MNDTIKIMDTQSQEKIVELKEENKSLRETILQSEEKIVELKEEIRLLKLTHQLKDYCMLCSYT